MNLRRAFHSYLPYSGLRIGVDSILIPTGEILPNAKGSVNDFWSEPKKIGRDLEVKEAVGNCGEGCTGWDNAWLVGKHDVKNEVRITISRTFGR